MEEFMFLGLRMTEGVDEGLFRRLFGCGMEEVYGEVIGKNIRDGLLRMDCDFEGKEEHAALRRLSLTEKGLDVSNYVMAQFLL